MKYNDYISRFCYTLAQLDKQYELFGLRKIYTITVIKKQYPRPLSNAVPPTTLRPRVSYTPARTTIQQQLHDRIQRLRVEAIARSEGDKEDEGVLEGAVDYDDSELQPEDNGNYRLLIQRRQACKVLACRQYGQYCYYTSLDIRSNYLLVIATVMRPQAKGIRDSTLTVNSPSKAGVSKLQKYKHNNGSDHPPTNLYSAKGKRLS